MREGSGIVGRTIPVNLDALAKLTSLAVDLDTVVQELLEPRTVKDTVTGGTGVVNDELVLSSRSFSGSGLGLREKESRREIPGLAY